MGNAAHHQPMDRKCEKLSEATNQANGWSRCAVVTAVPLVKATSGVPSTSTSPSENLGQSAE
jgi:hypothetical protein